MDGIEQKEGRGSWIAQLQRRKKETDFLVNII
jgi:hypothetical protein